MLQSVTRSLPPPQAVKAITKDAQSIGFKKVFMVFTSDLKILAAEQSRSHAYGYKCKIVWQQ
jgi:hypothetical protein